LGEIAYLIEMGRLFQVVKDFKIRFIKEGVYNLLLYKGPLLRRFKAKERRRG
jgi:hypothetical protein